MKFGISKLEKFALTSHLFVQPSPNPENGRKRLRAWDELGVMELADQLSMLAAQFPAEIRPAEWASRTPVLVDLNVDVLEFLIAGLGVQTSGVWADKLTPLRERLESLRDKKYELPPELRVEIPK